jgi:hypothetical protein
VEVTICGPGLLVNTIGLPVLKKAKYVAKQDHSISVGRLLDHAYYNCRHFIKMAIQYRHLVELKRREIKIKVLRR